MGDGRALCQPWEISTFPALDARPEKLRVLTLVQNIEGLPDLLELSSILTFEIKN